MTNNRAWLALPLAALWMAGCTKPAEQTAAEKEKEAAEQAKAEAPKPVPITIPAGTPLKIRTTTTLSTKDSKAGETFFASLAEPLVIDGVEVAPKGAEVEGRIVTSDEGGRVKGRAAISVRLTELHVGNKVVAISTSTAARQAKATKKQDAVKVGIGAGIGAAIGAIAGGGKGAAIGAASGGAAGTGVVLATRGEPAVIPAESVLTFSLTSPVTVERTKS